MMAGTALPRLRLNPGALQKNPAIKFFAESEVRAGCITFHTPTSGKTPKSVPGLATILLTGQGSRGSARA